MFKSFDICSQWVENLRWRLRLRKPDLCIKPILNPAILSLVLVGSRKLNSNQLSFLIILPRHERTASILCLAGFGLTLLEDLTALAVKFKKATKAVRLHLSSEGPNCPQELRQLNHGIRHEVVKVYVEGRLEIGDNRIHRQPQANSKKIPKNNNLPFLRGRCDLPLGGPASPSLKYPFKI